MLSEDRLHSVGSEMEQQFFVGRDEELRLFRGLLDLDNARKGILNVYGTGGVGKSYLLDEFRRLSVNANRKFILLDCRVFPGIPLDFCRHLLRVLQYPLQRLEKTMDSSEQTEICLDVIREKALREKIVLALDTFEAIGEMEYWLREVFLPQLPIDVLVVISGRFPLQGSWLASPLWRHKVHRMLLAELDLNAVKRYLEHAGVMQDQQIHHIWTKTKGHPLTLSLIVSTTLVGTMQKFLDENEVFSYVVDTWLKEVPDPEMRELVETASVLRQFNQELLSRVLDKEVTTTQFLKLTGYSFVQRVERGWLLHDLLRDAIGLELRLRRPEFHNRLWKRCVLYYCNKMKLSAKRKSAAWENGEFLYYIGNQFVQFLLYRQSICFSVEPLHPSNWSEAERYIEQRRLTAKDSPFVFTNRETNESVEFLLTANESLNILNQIRLKELYDLDPTCVKLIRNAEGKVYGMMEIIPINEATMDYLIARPLSSSYFRHLSESARKELMVPGHTKAGYFAKILDVYDFADPSMMQASLFTLITYILTAGYVVAAPTENPISNAICTSLGLEKAKDVVHYDYDGVTPTSYYVMDTRGKNIHRYLNKMIASFGLSEDGDEEDERLQDLTSREKEVVVQIMKGKTNIEIAGELYLSEATVKKHIGNIFRKLDVNNRVQLINKCTERNTTFG
ncbi:LuxR family transcriptional regulator [Paenibacillus sp. R14(2021)]|uniref:helix-turn-helix transcriptional regulator n=1 Tax=Paenibacillus sp. R14(2021) TaxID=2859228 RepID=UPI001C6123D7|nr:LuxR family transcriptional regulator [Paenibacillus sp. R14(2021)]